MIAVSSHELLDRLERPLRLALGAPPAEPGAGAPWLEQLKWDADGLVAAVAQETLEAERLRHQRVVLRVEPLAGLTLCGDLFGRDAVLPQVVRKQ